MRDDTGREPVRAVTIADVLELPVITAGQPEVLAGEARLSRAVRWVHVTELLDPASFLEGGELILTTGMPQVDDPALVRDYVDQLADIEAAGLVFELGRRYQRAPDALVHACRDRDLPLIVLGRGVRFIEITQTVHALILDAQGELLRRSQRINDTFSALTLRGASAGEIAEAAAELTGCPVVVENLVHQAVICAPAGRPVGRVLSAWPRRSHATPTPDATAPSGPEEWLVMPLERNGGRWGRLILLPDETDPVTGPEHVMVLDRTAATLNLTRLSGYARWEREAHRTALRDLVDRRFRTPTDARHRAESLGLPVTGHRLMALLIRHDTEAIAFRPASGTASGWAPGKATGGAPGKASGRAAGVASGSAPGKTSGPSAGAATGPAPDAGVGAPAGAGGGAADRDAFGDRLAAHLAASGVRAIVGATGPGVTGVLIALARTTAWQPVAHRIGRFAAEELGPDAVVAAGSGVADLADVARSFHEARQVIDAIRPGTARRPVHTQADIGLPELLYALRDDPRVQGYVQRQLGRLTEHDARHGGDLLGTLRHYLAETGNISAAAKRSGLSRQAFYQRIRTIERICGADLSDGAHRTQLHVALTALDALSSPED